MSELITPDTFRLILPKICSRETSQSPEGWHPEDPYRGHCRPVTLLAQQIFKGIILNARVVDLSTNRSLGPHCFNQLPNGTIEDFTLSQFRGIYLQYINVQPIERSVLLKDHRINSLYEALFASFMQYTNIGFKTLH
jgi:hypothetical protein